MLCVGCALGANMYWCTGLHLYTPLPFRPGKGGFGEYFRTHFFVNSGNLMNLSKNFVIPCVCELSMIGKYVVLGVCGTVTDLWKYGYV